MLLPANRFMRKDDFVYVEFANLFKYKSKVFHAFTTREGGCSKGSFRALNLGFTSGDFTGNVLKNFAVLGQKLDIDIQKIVYSKQVHGNKVRVVTDRDVMAGVDLEKSSFEYDAMVTNCKNIYLMAFFADCVPVFFYDVQKNVVAIAHSGWKGTYENVSANVVDTLKKEYNSNPQDLIVTIGPSIGNCCFEVGHDVIEKFAEKYENIDDLYYLKNECEDDNERKYNLDLWGMIRKCLIDCGLKQENITTSGVCTKCKNEMFYSYRAQNGLTGRLVGIIALK